MSGLKEISAGADLSKDFIRTHKACVNDWGFKYVEGQSFIIRLQNPYGMLSASFRRVAGRPDLMRIDTYNGRYEDEVHGIYRIEEARALYAAFVKAGFEAF